MHCTWINHALPALVGLLAAIAPLRAQDWELNLATGPAGRQLPRMGYDTLRGHAVMFGGYSTSTNSALNDTWTFDGLTWTARTPATSPPPRDTFAFSYDSVRGVMTMFGGVNSAVFPSSITNETWEWDGTNWNQAMPATAPSPRFGAMMAFDRARNVHVMFGGASSAAYLTETWEWDGTNWTQRTPAVSPLGRSNGGMVYDVRRGRVVLFGGTRGGNAPQGDTWEYDGTTWTQVTATPAPAARTGHVMVYDDLRGVTVVSQGLAGTTRISDTWEFDGIYWHRYRGAAVLTGGGRVNAAMAFDILRQRQVLFGGVAATPRPTDTWELRPDRPSFTQFGDGCTGSAGVPALDSTSLPALGGNLQLVVSAVPASTATLLLLGRTSTVGLPIPPTTCELRVLSLLLVLTAPAAGGVASYPLAVPNAPELAGATLWFQAGALDLPANPLGLTLSNGARAVLN